jgi:putative thioredoxin
MSQPPVALEATKENFPQLVLENSRKGPVLVDFWADWAGPSLRQREVLLRLSGEYGGRFLLVTVNTDREKDIARELGVKSLPSCKLFLNGKPVEHVHGMQTEADYRALIERHLLPLADKAQAAALKAWEAGDQDKALQVLAEAAMAAPDNAAIPRLLAKLLIQAKRHSDAHAVLTSLPEALRADAEIRRLRTHLELILAAEGAPTPEALEDRLARDPGDPETRFTLAAVHLLADDYSSALELLAELIRQRPDYRSGLPRLALAEVLELLDPADERVRRYRRLLFSH